MCMFFCTDLCDGGDQLVLSLISFCTSDTQVRTRCEGAQMQGDFKGTEAVLHMKPKKAVGLIPSLGMEFACSLCVIVGSLQVLQPAPTVQKYPCEANWKLRRCV